MKKQSGVFLLEALVAILIFAFGVLGMLAMSSAAVMGQTDAQVRSDAAAFADQLAGQIALNVDRTSAATVTATLAPFALNSDNTTPVGPCPTQNIPNAASAANPAAAPIIANWLATVTGPGGLPGATATSVSVIVVSPPNPVNAAAAPIQNAVTITECWQSPTDRGQHNYVTTVYVDY